MTDQPADILITTPELAGLPGVTLAGPGERLEAPGNITLLDVRWRLGGPKIGASGRTSAAGQIIFAVPASIPLEPRNSLTLTRLSDFVMVHYVSCEDAN